MFKLFKKETESPVVEVVKTKYPTIVDEIHNEFFTAGENILAEAPCLLKELETKDLAKGKRLAAIGFGKTREAVVAIETENKLATTKEIADLVMYYRINYPNNKFITEEQVKQICEKYGLVCGNTSAYKGFVPEKKLELIEAFKVKEKDFPFACLLDRAGNVKKVLNKSDFIETNSEFFKTRMSKGGEGFFTSNANGVAHLGYDTTNLYGGASRVMPFDDSFKICAPLKDMEVSSRQKVVGYKIQDIPDPVVLQPVRGGYLVVACWGDEASDEIVVNQINN